MAIIAPVVSRQSLAIAECEQPLYSREPLTTSNGKTLLWLKKWSERTENINHSPFSTLESSVQCAASFLIQSFLQSLIAVLKVQ